MKAAWLAVALLVPAAAHADDQDRDYCPARPGLGTPACTMAPGTVSVETSLADWTLDTQGGDRTDTVSIGDTSVRIGISDRVEAQIGWTPLGIVRERSGNVVDRTARAGVRIVPHCKTHRSYRRERSKLDSRRDFELYLE